MQAWYQAAVGKQGLSTSKSVLVFNSGYHANIGILPALTALPVKTLILADKLVHASIIDGMRLSQSKLVTYRRYRHNDYEHLARFIEQADETVERIIIVTESVFSMDGDRADLLQLVQLKAKDARIELYVDEAHAVGCWVILAWDWRKKHTRWPILIIWWGPLVKPLLQLALISCVMRSSNNG